MALQKSREQLGDDATLLYDPFLPSSMKEICESHGKEKGGPWECYHAQNFYGWEAERVVVVTTGLGFILEMATRAKTELILILATEGSFQENIKRAANEGLVDFKVIEKERKTENTNENLEDTATRDLEHTQTDAHYTTDTANVEVEVEGINSDVKTEKKLKKGMKGNRIAFIAAT